MNRSIRRLLDSTDGKLPSDIESEQILGYAEALVARLDLHRVIEQAEPTILADAVDILRKRFPEMDGEHGLAAFDQSRRDLGLVLRYATFAMVMRDPDFIHDKLAVWFRTIMFALSNPKRVRESLVALEESVTRNLPAMSARELVPYIQVVSKEFQVALGEETARRAA